MKHQGLNWGSIHISPAVHPAPKRAPVWPTLLQELIAPVGIGIVVAALVVWLCVR